MLHAMCINLTYSPGDHAIVVAFNSTLVYQPVNLRGFRASMNPRFDGGIPDLMDKIPESSDNFNQF